MFERYRKDRDGVAAVEFALIALPLIFLMIAIFDYGMYLNTTLKLENTSRAAAQYLLVGGSEDDIEDNILMASSLNISADNRGNFDIEVERTYECDGGVEVSEGTDCGNDDYLREFIRVTISTVYDTIIPFPGIPDTIDLSGSVKLQNR